VDSRSTTVTVTKVEEAGKAMVEEAAVAAVKDTQTARIGTDIAERDTTGKAMETMGMEKNVVATVVEVTETEMEKKTKKEENTADGTTDTDTATEMVGMAEMTETTETVTGIATATATAIVTVTVTVTVIAAVIIVPIILHHLQATNPRLPHHLPHPGDQVHRLPHHKCPRQWDHPQQSLVQHSFIKFIAVQSSKL
jgi:hypothetical protein